MGYEWTEVQLEWSFTPEDDDPFEEDEITVLIEGAVEPGRPAKHNGHPDNWEPEDPQGVEIYRIKKENGADWEGTLSSYEVDQIEMALVEKYFYDLDSEQRRRYEE